MPARPNADPQMLVEDVIATLRHMIRAMREKDHAFTSAEANVVLALREIYLTFRPPEEEEEGEEF